MDNTDTGPDKENIMSLHFMQPDFHGMGLHITDKGVLDHLTPPLSYHTYLTAG